MTLLNIIGIVISAMVGSFIGGMALKRMMNDQQARQSEKDSIEWKNAMYKTFLAHNKIDIIQKILSAENDDMTLLRGRLLLDHAKKRYAILNLKSAIIYNAYVNTHGTYAMRKKASVDLIVSNQRFIIAMSFDSLTNADNINVANEINTYIKVSLDVITCFHNETLSI
jgi:hypothetical protein